ncbi:hypothetical protein Tco_1479446 [Tanacetum coccineum]
MNNNPSSRGRMLEDKMWPEPIRLVNLYLLISLTKSSTILKGKGIMQEPERHLKRKKQVALDEQMARDIQA